ncbi:MAG: alpha-ketoglutarate-dependent dioxygenase AlkB [Pseudomonadota bacterium]
MAEIDIAGAIIHRSALSDDQQAAILSDCRSIVRRAPLVRPVTRRGKTMSVQMTSAGRAGWVIDRGRYAYVGRHPETGLAWPAIPRTILEVWERFAEWPDQPDCCLVNWYEATARMGLHQDKDEGRFDAPVLSISLGAPARFRIGGTERSAGTQSTVLHSGDVLIMAGDARLAYHGIDRILPAGLISPVARGGRINLTLRVVAEDAIS